MFFKSRRRIAVKRPALPSSSSCLIPRSSFDRLWRDERGGEECDNILPVMTQTGKIPWREESGRLAGSTGFAAGSARDGDRCIITWECTILLPTVVACTLVPRARIPLPGKKLMPAIRFSGLTLRKNGDRWCPTTERKINFAFTIKRALFRARKLLNPL